MGLIKATGSAISGVAADQWKEYFICPALEDDVIMRRVHPQKQQNSANVKSSSGAISDGSIVSVGDGQCALLTGGGQVLEVWDEPGEHVVKTGISPSILGGSTLVSVGREVLKRISFGGDPGGAVTQRVYYISLLEKTGIPIACDAPIPFRVVDTNTGMDIDCCVEFEGVYSLRVVDPARAYKRLIGNYDSDFRLSTVSSQMRSELLTSFQKVLSRYGAMGIRISRLPEFIPQIVKEMVEEANAFQVEARGIAVVSLAIDSLNLTTEDHEMMLAVQRAGIYRDPAMAAGRLVDAKAAAMVAAANNTGGR